MFNYEKRLEFPINIKQTNAQMATAIITQFGGPNCLLVYTFPTSLKHPYMEILNSIISYTEFSFCAGANHFFFLFFGNYFFYHFLIFLQNTIDIYTH